MRTATLVRMLNQEILPASAVVVVMVAVMGMLGDYIDPSGAVMLVACSALLAIAGVFSEEEAYQRPA